MSGSHKDLSTLLQEWTVEEPSVGFDAKVWQKIHQPTAGDVHSWGLIELLRNWIVARPRHAFAVAATVAVMLSFGVGMAVARLAQNHHATSPLLHSRTLAGAYLAMSSGDVR